MNGNGELAGYGIIMFLLLIIGIFWLVFPIIVLSKFNELIKEARGLRSDLTVFHTSFSTRVPLPPLPPSIPKPVSAYCPCSLCNAKLEFDPADAGKSATCPNCNAETTLHIPETCTV